MVSAPSQVCPVPPLGSRSQAEILLADVNHSASQEDLVSSWEPAHSLVLCEQARVCLRSELFVGKFSFSLSFFLSLAIPQIGLLSHISSLRLSSGHSGLVLTLSLQPVPPCSASTRWWQMRVSGLLLHWGLWLGAYSVGFFLFSFFLLAMLPSEILKLPTGPLVREFPALWKLPLLHDSLSGTGLCP